MTSFLHSIRWRIQAWHGIILLGAISAFCLTAYYFAKDHQFRRIDRDLQQTEHNLIRALMQSGQPANSPVKSGSPEGLADRLRAGEISLSPEITALFAGSSYFTIRDIGGRILLQSANVPDDVSVLPVPATGFIEDLRSIGLRRESLRSSAHGFSSTVGRDVTAERDEMHRFAWLLAGSGIGVWLLGLIGGWWLAGRAIKPIATISRTASHIAEGNLTERIDTTGNESELDQLGHVLNQTFDRLHTAFERQKQFTADASHELRTPLAILIAETQRSLRRERSPEEYRETIRTCHDTSERMRHLVEALLILARQETANDSPSRETCDFATLLADTATHLRPLADAANITLITDLQPAVCQADSAALGILASNLLGNAIRHHHLETPDRTVQLTSRRDGDRVAFTVTDNGPGIPTADLPHIFERFYRVDKVRTGDTGHAGLGLAIAKTIAENHGGTITVQSTAGHGTTFTVSLPANR